MTEPASHTNEIAELFDKRLKGVEDDMRRTWRHFGQGDALMAETGVNRADAASQRQQMSVRRDPVVSGLSLANAEALKGDRENFLPVSFLAMGTSVSRAVARVRVSSTGEVGSGFLCGPGLFITNQHVLLTAQDARSARVEFDFVEDDNIQPTVFSLDPARCFVADNYRMHDYAVVAVGDRVDGSEDLRAFGWCPMSNADNKHAIGEFANIIQHPEGREKQVVLQDNLIMSRGERIPEEDHILHYVADTEKGSSGSPVFNNAWQVIALHHWGQSTSAFHEQRMYAPRSVNQGIRISRIVNDLHQKVGGLNGQGGALIRQLLDLGERVLPKDVMSEIESQRAPRLLSAKADKDEVEVSSMPDQVGATWTIPIEVTVSIPGGEPVRNTSSADPQSTYSVRQSKSEDDAEPLTSPGAESRSARVGEGYRADFLDHHVIELPKVKTSLSNLVVPLNRPEQFPSAKHGELQFTHFSCVMRKDRKLPFFGACNVDGKTLFGINDDGVDYDYAEDDISIFRPSIEPGGESGTSWRTDSRIPTSDQTGEKYYTGKNKLVPRNGSDDAERYIATADFDRGHMVRRTEPIWGTREAGHEANVHTFTHVNSAPQTVRFNRNQDRPPSAVEAGEEQRSWYGMEVAVLRAATNQDKKMCVFSGPIFKESDPFYGPGKSGGGDRQIPLSFWKVVVWEEEENLRSLAMKYSQEWSIEQDDEGSESLVNPGELFVLRDFLTSVEVIEAETGISFDSKVTDSDILNGLDQDAISEMSIEDLATHIAQI